MIEWIKRKLGITDIQNSIQHLDQRTDAAEQRIDDRLSELKQLTRVDADIGVRGNSTVILTGVFNGRGYVRFYDVRGDQFDALVRQMKDMQQHALIRNIDEPPCFNLKASFDL